MLKKTKTMASGPITAWQTEGKAEAGTDLLFFGPKITADGDGSHGISR